MESASSRWDIVGICFSICKHRRAERQSKDDLTDQDQEGQLSDNIRRQELHDQRGLPRSGLGRGGCRDLCFDSNLGRGRFMLACPSLGITAGSTELAFVMGSGSSVPRDYSSTAFRNQSSRTDLIVIVGSTISLQAGPRLKEVPQLRGGFRVKK